MTIREELSLIRHFGCLLDEGEHKQGEAGRDGELSGQSSHWHRCVPVVSSQQGRQP